MNDLSSVWWVAVISSSAFPGSHQALPPGRVPLDRGLSRTWVEHDLFPMLSLPVCAYLQEKKRGGLPPDFLWSLVALASLMRLSLLKAAHVAVGQCRVAGNPEKPRDLLCAPDGSQSFRFSHAPEGLVLFLTTGWDLHDIDCSQGAFVQALTRSNDSLHLLQKGNVGRIVSFTFCNIPNLLVPERTRPNGCGSCSRVVMGGCSGFY